MRAARLHEWGKPLKVDEVPVPKIGPGDVLVKTMSAGINGGDIHYCTHNFAISERSVIENERKWQVRELPVTIGHEASGIVEAIGSEVRLPLKVGDEVIVRPNINCGVCFHCRSGMENLCEDWGTIGYVQRPHTEYGRWLVRTYNDGTWAEYVKLPAGNLIKKPPSLPWDLAAKMGMMAVAYRACNTVNLHSGETVVVNSPTGGSGIAMPVIAKIFGLSKLILVGRTREKLEKTAKLAGPIPTEIICSSDEDVRQRIMQLTDNRGADVLVDYSPAAAKVTTQCLYALRNAGRAVLAGGCTEDLSITFRYIMSKAIVITGSHGFTHPELAQLTSLASTGYLDVEKIETRHYPIEKVNEAMKEINGPYWVVLDF